MPTFTGPINIVTGANPVTAPSLMQNGLTMDAAKTVSRQVFVKTAIADSVATTVCTATVPNATNAAAFRILVMSSITGANAYESTRVAEFFVVVTRKAGVNAVAAIALVTAAATTIATTAAGATLTTNLTLGAMAGAVGASNTFTIQATNVGTPGQVSETTLLIEEINALASGITLA